MAWPQRATILDDDGKPKIHRHYLLGTGKTFGVFLHHFVGSDAPAVFPIEDLVAERDEVVCRVTFRGTHRGPLLGIPATGKSVAVDEVYISRFVGDKCLEEWRVMDELGLTQQLGVMDATRAA